MQSVIHHNFQSFAIEWLYLLFLLLLDNRAIFSLHISPQLIAICHSSISSARKAIGCDSPVGMLKCKTTLGDELVMNISRMCTTGTRKKNYLGIHTLKIIYGSTEKTKTCVLKKQNEKRIAKHEMSKKIFFCFVFFAFFDCWPIWRMRKLRPERRAWRKRARSSSSRPLKINNHIN